MKRQSGLKRFVAVFIPLLLMMVFILFPFYWTFVTSVKPQDELYGAVVTYWPSHITFEAYSKLFTTTVNFFAAMKNSFIVASLTTIVSLTASTLAAYAFSRYQFTGRKILMCTFLCNNMFPTVLLLIPLYTIMRKMGLLYCLVATGVYIFMTSWNEYTFAMMFTNTDTRTIPVALKSLIGQLGVQWDLLTAGGIITIIPVCIMFFFAQKRLVEGLTAGAVKG